MNKKFKQFSDFETIPRFSTFLNQFNNAIPENNSDLENVIQIKYYDIDKL